MLERRRDVGEEDELAAPIGLREKRRERFENAEFGLERFAVVHVQGVFPCPMESFAIGDLQTFEINVVFLIKGDVALGEIFTNDADQFYRCEKTRSNGG